MTKRELGEVVSYLRKKRGIEVKDLCKGICCEASLIRVEEGERIPDYMMLERIFERLGKSVNKIEILFNQDEYNVYCIQKAIRAALDEKEYDEVKQILAYFECLENAERPLYRQYTLKIKAILAIVEHRNNDAIQLLEEAIEITLPNFKLKKINQYLLGQSELLCILMWIDQKYKKDDEYMNYFYYKEVLLYIRDLYTDEELLVDIYPKAAMIFVKMLEQYKQYELAENLCKKTIDLLTSNGVILYLPQFLLLYRRNLILNGKKKEASNIEKQENALKWVYETYKIECPGEEIAIWKRYEQREIYLMSEVVKQERKRLKKSQEKIADIAKMDQKTISRIETGRYAPKPGTFQRLKEHLEINRDIYSTLLVVKDFKLLEIRRDIGRAMSLRDYEEAEKLFNKIKNSIDDQNKENIQYIGYMEAILEYNKDKLTQEEMIKKCCQLLSITRTGNQLEHLDKIVLSRHEILIVNFMARMYKELNQYDKSIKLLENALKGYQSSKVNLKHHYVGISMIYGNLMNYYEENGELEKAEEYCKKAIRLQLKCHRGNLIGEALMQKAYMIEKSNGDRKTCDFFYKQAFQFYILMKDIYSKDILEKHYLEIFKTEIE